MEFEMITLQSTKYAFIYLKKEIDRSISEKNDKKYGHVAVQTSLILMTIDQLSWNLVHFYETRKLPKN